MERATFDHLDALCGEVVVLSINIEGPNPLSTGLTAVVKGPLRRAPGSINGVAGFAVEDISFTCGEDTRISGTLLTIVAGGA
jgi:hypothetical protein